MIQKAITTVCIILITLSVFAQWTTVSTFSTRFNAIHFTNDQTGFAVGTNGSIFRTRDGGANWDTLSSGVTSSLFSVFFVSPDTGFVGGYRFMLKTTDSGNTWQQQINRIGYFNEIYFPSSRIGYALISTFFSDAESFKTTDGGLTWNKSGALEFPFSWGAIKDVKAMHFPNTQVGYAVGREGIIFKTNDAGSTWNYLTLSSSQYNLESVFFLNADTGFAVGHKVQPSPCLCGILMNTIDGGKTWSDLYFNERLNSIYFLNETIGYYVGATDTIMKSTNGGFAWSYEVSSTNSNLVDIFFPSNNRGYVLGWNDLLSSGSLVRLSLNTEIGNSVNIQEDNFSVYPNPASSTVYFRYIVNEKAQVSLKIYDLNGVVVTLITDNNQIPGTYQDEIDLNKLKLSAGVYFASLKINDAYYYRKIVLTR